MAKSHTGHLTGSDDVVVGGVPPVRRHPGRRPRRAAGHRGAAAPGPRAPDRRRRVHLRHLRRHRRPHGRPGRRRRACACPTSPPTTQKALHEWIPGYLRVSNPVDNGGAPSARLAGPQDPRRHRRRPERRPCSSARSPARWPSMAEPLAQDLVDVAETTDKPICVIWGSPLADERRVHRDPARRRRSSPVFRTFGNCVRAVKAYFDYHAFLRATARRSPSRSPAARRRPSRRGAAARAGRRPVGARVQAGARRLRHPRHRRAARARRAAEAVQAAEAIGYPW